MSASDLDLALSQVRNTPDILRAMVGPAHSDALSWKPQPSRYSIAEVLAHIAHVDEFCFGPRLKQVITETNPIFTDYDDASFLAQGPDFVQDGPARLESFVQTRSRWVIVLEGMTSAQAAAAGQHPKLGPITGAQLLHEWAFHDLGHVRQIAELLRARCYFPHIGPFQTFYTVRP